MLPHCLQFLSFVKCIGNSEFYIKIRNSYIFIRFGAGGGPKFVTAADSVPSRHISRIPIFGSTHRHSYSSLQESYRQDKAEWVPVNNFLLGGIII